MIAERRLVKAIDVTVPTNKAFFLVSQRERQNAATLLFADWILAQFPSSSDKEGGDPPPPPQPW
jgi:hypothetical protein